MTVDAQSKSGIDDIFTDFAAGTLSPARHILVSCKAEMCEDTLEDIRFRETVCASQVTAGGSVSMTDGFFADVLSNLPAEVEPKILEVGSGRTPKSLLSLIGTDLESVKWRKVAPGVSLYHILADKDGLDGRSSIEKLYLLKAAPGQQLPEHSHTGEEWTLIMQGSYVAGGKQYARGALHIEDEDTTHEPYIDSEEDCICLVVTDGPLQMTGFLPKLFQPIAGI